MTKTINAVKEDTAALVKGQDSVKKDTTTLLEGQQEANEAQKKLLDAISDNKKELLEALSREKGVPLAALAQILARLGETGVSNEPAEIERRLAQKADEYLALRTQVRLLSGDDPQVHALQHDAEVALTNSDFALARAKLQEAVEIDRAAILALADRARARSLAAAQSLEKSADVATLTLHYRDAADDLSKAAALVTPFDRHEIWRLMMKQAAALQSQGDEFGDKLALDAAISLYGRISQLLPRAENAADWAMTQNDLGNALFRLGERESGTERLEEAVAAYRAALEEMTRERVPLDWAMTQSKLAFTCIRVC